MHADERRERRIGARKLHLNKTEKRQASADAAVTLHSNPADAQFFHGGQKLEGKGVLDPVFRDNGRDLGFHKRAHPLHDRELLGAQGFVEVVEIAVRRR